MLKRLVLGFFGVMLVGAGIGLFVAERYLATPTFTVINQSDATIEASASWRENTKVLGRLPPGEDLTFRVNDEAGMRFSAVYPDGRIISSSHATYFTNGMTVTATFTGSNVQVSAEL
ncbi:hypothetical protein RE428_42490 [Marinobacter nanhaiticus D15-8W]|uniref:Uncharacterized protein n=1 Tax=Marinobacter nanhaiticus D15-8W TaxID=626887 RepID=N6WWD8_9GAMM|nr:hypothetical protein [Marinobacter nanhaiticus]ENO15911.1 hypothetical protein J057_11181 [Marinobacter nanhaiticus D15-8W]BES73231.1 hypothetical protein RE428_42490 [Marinobacter nanhaiticus D15-8W]